MKPSQVDDAYLLVRQAAALRAALESLPTMTTVSLDGSVQDDHRVRVRMAQVSVQSERAREQVRAAVATELDHVLAKLADLGIEGTPEDFEEYLRSRRTPR